MPNKLEREGKNIIEAAKEAIYTLEQLLENTENMVDFMEYSDTKNTIEAALEKVKEGRTTTETWSILRATKVWVKQKNGA